jgi:hypothetical protein
MCAKISGTPNISCARELTRRDEALERHAAQKCRRSGLAWTVPLSAENVARCDTTEIQQRRAEKAPELGVPPVALVLNVFRLRRSLRAGFWFGDCVFLRPLFVYRIPFRGSAHPLSLCVLSLSVYIFDVLILFRMCTPSAVFLLVLSRILWKFHGTAEGAVLVHPV